MELDRQAMNSSSVTSFLLTAYEDIGLIRYFCFFVIFIMYSSIILANSLLISLICAERSLHEPMYVFLCNLCINELYGSTGLYPVLLLNMLSKTHVISKTHCILQVFCLHSYGTAELLNLAVMSYDRYVAIIQPLQYNLIMTPAKVVAFIFVIWMYPILKVATTVIFTMTLPLCGNTINKVYCDNYSLVKLSCINTTTINVYGLVNLFLSIVVPFFFIFYSYAKIFIVCLKSKGSRAKALKTCTPHLASLLNFSVACFFEIVQSRFDLSYIPSLIRVIISVYFLMISPVFTPIIYGLRLPKIRTLFKRVCVRRLFPQ
ncbi:olfactory receptor 6N2-like [Brienomyrus brachyistius]|uniref:olfactory receptor 6N2-like n=1 Tax=Brienomyrus brachyistius TaxID=42636 RepID=UPI0020B31E1D|nr:olfactory receptor 6N2-like [Brienomyrus brachyistius]